MLGYRIELEPDDNGTLLATCPAFPEVTTFGRDRSDAVRHAVGAIEEAVAARIAEGEDVPKGHRRGPHLVRLRASTVLKIERYRQLREAGTTRTEPVRQIRSERKTLPD